MSIAARKSWSLLSIAAVLTILIGSGHPAFAYEAEIKALASEMAAKMSGAGKKTIAVVDFTDLQGNITELGRFLAEELSIALAESSQSFEVVDRNNLASILKEHKLSASGLVDPATTRRLGQISGVEALVMGSLTPFGDSIRLTVKIVDTNTARMIGSSRGNIAKIGAIQELFNKGIAPEGSPVAGSGTAQAAALKKPAADVPQAVELNKFVFELQGCELAGQTVTCALAILNKAKDRELVVSGTSVIFDDHGNEYTVSSAEIANTSRELNRYNSIEKILPYGVPVQASLTFGGVLPETTSLTSFRLYGTDREKPEFTVDFRDISLEAKHATPIGGMSLAGESGGAAQPAGSASMLDTVKGQVKEGVGAAVKSTLKRWTDKLVKPPSNQ